MVAANLIELLEAVTHDLACLADIAQFLGQVQQIELATCYFFFRGYTHSPAQDFTLPQ